MTKRFQDIDFDLDKLPAMPIVAAQMIELINSPMSSSNQLAKVIEKDPAVAARVLKIANSSFYSMSRQVTTLPTAIVILGERSLKNLVLAASMRSVHSAYGPIEKMLWEDSMLCALGSRFLSRKLGLADPEESFMAGLFRHIGKVVINNQEGLNKEFVAEIVSAESESTIAQERETLGANHAEIGAAVLENWQLSEGMSLVALQHFSVDLSGIDDQNVINMISLVNIASAFPAIFGIYGAPQEINLSELPGARQLNLDTDKLTALLEEFQEVFEENREQFLS